ncbi:MAG TPA: lecithin retinol acyltransferase family protein [Deltaproteobacteria bacterium]|nr:lecithin retinol acyltransferase family protein [Deltaproteobacteria bacterium]
MINTMIYDGDQRSMLMKSQGSRSVLLSEADLLPGDHIYVKRSSRFYKHHGIFIGNGRVIHVSGSIREKVHPEVRETDLSSFLKGGVPRRRVYEKRLPASETIRAAKKQLQNGGYSMVWNNCEHFATYCATGKKKSLQARKIIAGLSTVTAGIAVFVLTRAVFHR